MKIKEIMDLAVREGINVDPRSKEEIEKILKERKNEYAKLTGVEKEIYDLHKLESPYEDSRIIWGDPDSEINEAWVGIDVDTPELMLVKQVSEKKGTEPLVISHHPLGRSYSNFYEVMDMQADILAGMGVASSIADNLTRKRKAEVSRRVAPSNHFRVQDAARILNVSVMNIHTPADNHVTKFLNDLFMGEKPDKLKDIIDILLGIPEYKKSAINGTPPRILTGEKNNKCGKVFVDMTGGTENTNELLKNIVQSGVSTVVAMHMSDKHYETAKDHNLNVIIAGHISSDNVGVNLVLDKIMKKLGKMNVVEFSGFIRVERNG